MRSMIKAVQPEADHMLLSVSYGTCIFVHSETSVMMLAYAAVAVVHVNPIVRKHRSKARADATK